MPRRGRREIRPLLQRRNRGLPVILGHPAASRTRRLVVTLRPTRAPWPCPGHRQMGRAGPARRPTQRMIAVHLRMDLAAEDLQPTPPTAQNLRLKRRTIVDRRRVGLCAAVMLQIAPAPLRMQQTTSGFRPLDLGGVVPGRTGLRGRTCQLSQMILSKIVTRLTADPVDPDLHLTARNGPFLQQRQRMIIARREMGRSEMAPQTKQWGGPARLQILETKALPIMSGLVTQESDILGPLVQTAPSSTAIKTAAQLP
jgi:hypothetical protein